MQTGSGSAKLTALVLASIVALGMWVPAAGAAVSTQDDAGNAGNDAAFGQLVSSFVGDLHDDDTNESVGYMVANYVLANNPASDLIPDHAGPPTNGTQGPPDNVTTGPPENVSTGPPENVTTGPPDDDNEGESGDAETDDGGGPPDAAGSSNGSDDDEGSNGGGPPDDAGPP